jgi:predicted ATPase
LVATVPGECWFVDLAPVQEARLVIPTIAQTLGVSTSASHPALDSLKHYLRERQIVLLLDNFEQVVDAAAQISELLASAPGLKVLVTSRTVLHLSVEHEFSVPSLALPGRIDPTELGPLAQCESVQLLLERAKASGAKLTLTPENADDIANICLRLEGLPLALELAAARCKLFAPADLLVRLEHRLRILTAGARDQPLRQQTLRATLDWSYQLLQAEEQILFARLGVFAGGFTLEAAEAVCRDPSDSPLDVVEGLAALLDQSLLRQSEETTGERRFVMLETIREYACEQLVARGEESMLCNQHAAHFLRLAEQAHPLLFSAQQQEWYELLVLEQSNFRAALHWWRTNNQYTQVAQLGAALCWFWGRHGELQEEAQWLEWALTEMNRHPNSTPIAVRGKALVAVAFCAIETDDSPRARSLLEEYLALESQVNSFVDTYYALSHLAEILMWEGDFQRGKTLLERRLALSREHAFPTGVADALMELGYLSLLQGGCENASRLLEESLLLRRGVGTKTGVMGTLGYLSLVRREQGDFQRARLHLDEALALCYALDDKAGIGWILSELGVLAQLQNEYAQANEYLLQALALERELGSELGMAVVLGELGNLAFMQENVEQSRACYVESVTICHRHGNKVCLIWGLEGLAGVAALSGQATAAAQLLGAAEAYRQASGLARSMDERLVYERTVAVARAALGEARFDSAVSVGRTTALDDAITQALGTTKSSPETTESLTE